MNNQNVMVSYKVSKIKEHTIFYADDDDDDLMFLEEATEDIASTMSDIINLKLFREGDNLIESIENYTKNDLIVLLDVNMPKKSGFEFLNEIRRNDRIKNTKVIFYSSALTDSFIIKAKKLGANYYIQKPTDFTQLKTLVKKIINLDFTNNNLDNTFVLSKEFLT